MYTKISISNEINFVKTIRPFAYIHSRAGLSNIGLKIISRPNF